MCHTSHSLGCPMACPGSPCCVPSTCYPPEGYGTSCCCSAPCVALLCRPLCGVSTCCQPACCAPSPCQVACCVRVSCKPVLCVASFCPTSGCCQPFCPTLVYRPVTWSTPTGC
ncbi:KRTAP12-4 isoform 1 [Pan troglodytes]|uniref:KRTAP12-4 isoform 1 n=1 Tax=Pan troglodytes TaxID=9598 RepID=A0A2J8M8K3_PANTR|nr:keratin-associated protein 12-4 [Pan troglodytes]PNI55854.1 KRTAP12-4 isoform 1 [Pan troglodytes]